SAAPRTLAVPVARSTCARSTPGTRSSAPFTAATQWLQLMPETFRSMEASLMPPLYPTWGGVGCRPPPRPGTASPALLLLALGRDDRRRVAGREGVVQRVVELGVLGLALRPGVVLAAAAGLRRGVGGGERLAGGLVEPGLAAPRGQALVLARPVALLVGEALAVRQLLLELPDAGLQLLEPLQLPLPGTLLAALHACLLPSTDVAATPARVRTT